jgi:hypothetical protein
MIVIQMKVDITSLNFIEGVGSCFPENNITKYLNVRNSHAQLQDRIRTFFLLYFPMYTTWQIHIL